MPAQWYYKALRLRRSYIGPWKNSQTRQFNVPPSLAVTVSGGAALLGPAAEPGSGTIPTGRKLRDQSNGRSPPGVRLIITDGVAPTHIEKLALGFIPDLGVNGLIASGEARGLTPNVSFSMCVGPTFIDADQNITGAVLTFNEGVESFLAALSGLMVTIRQGTGCAGTVVLQGTAP